MRQKFCPDCDVALEDEEITWKKSNNKLTDAIRYECPICGYTIETNGHRTEVLFRMDRELTEDVCDFIHGTREKEVI